MEEEVMPIQRPKSFIPDEESQTEELSSPQSFIADEEEQHKPGIFSKIKSALTPEEKIHPGEGPKAKLDRFLAEVLTTDKHPLLKRILGSSTPGEEPLAPSIKEAGIKEPTTYLGGFRKGLYDEFIRPLTSAEGMAGVIALGKSGPFHGGVPKASSKAAQELPIRQSREIPYKASGDLPSNMPERELSVRQPAGLPPDMVLPEEQDIFNRARSERVKKVFEGESPRYTQEDLAKAKIENERLSQAPAGKREKFVSPFDKKLNIEESKPIEPVAEKEAPIVPISKELPKVSPENQADLELWFKYKKLYDTGKMTDQQMTEWAEIHNKVKDLKGSVTLKPHRFETLPEEPPEFTNYILPDGQRVKLQTSATKGAERTTFQLKGGKIVEAVREDVYSFPETKPEITIENAPPNQRAKMMRGAHEPVDILFNNPEDRELFGAGQRGFSKGQIKPGYLERFQSAVGRIVKQYGISEQEARTAVINYNAEIRRLGSAVDREGGNITAPTFEEFIESGKTELHGGLGGIKPSKRALDPITGPYAAALEKLFDSMGKTTENRVQQDIINKIERARRFAASAGVEDVGVKGAAQSLSKLKGEFEKVDVDKLKMTQPQVDSLFTAVKRAKITEGEKARGYTALFKLMNGEGVPQRNELRILDDVFGNDFAGKVVEMHGGIGSVGMKISKVANTMKAMMSSVDLSFPLKQGIGMIHKSEWRNAAVEQLKYFAKSEYYNAAMEAIESRPKFMLGRESGLFLAKHGSLTQGEEAFAHSYLGNLPSGIRMPFDASERAYVGGLNKLRSDLFDNLTELAEKAGNEVFASKQTENGIVKVPTKVAENIANYINVFTGRGKLGRLEPIANELNTVFWSPRLLSSRLTALNPKFYHSLDPFTRKEAIKSLFAVASASTIMNGLGAAAGGTVGYNILSSDFAKTRFKPSNNVLDPSGGFQQPIVAAARMIEELNRMSTGGKQEFGKPGIPGIAGNVLINKLSPLAGLAYDIASAKKFTGGGDYVDRFGKTKNILSEEGKRFVPMFIQDVFDIVNSDPSFAETVSLLPLTAFGAGEQNYPERKPKKSVFRKLGS